jgi:hypothetical protein
LWKTWTEREPAERDEDQRTSPAIVSNVPEDAPSGTVTGGKTVKVGGNTPPSPSKAATTEELAAEHTTSPEAAKALADKTSPDRRTIGANGPNDQDASPVEEPPSSWMVLRSCPFTNKMTEAREGREATVDALT